MKGGETMEWLCFAGAGVCGIIFGIGVMLLYIVLKTATGTLRIDHRNPEKDVYRFEINNLDKINSKKRVVLKIDNDADLSQK
jgi:hypothetical protein